MKFVIQKQLETRYQACGTKNYQNSNFTKRTLVAISRSEFKYLYHHGSYRQFAYNNFKKISAGNCIILVRTSR